MATQGMTLASKAPAGSVPVMVRCTDVSAFAAVCRTVLGFLLFPTFMALSPADAVNRWLLPYFLAILLALRIVPAVLRQLLPFSREVQAHWFRYRILAKRYDSYQWRKLLWFGLGMIAYIAMRGDALPVQAYLAASCTVAGLIGAIRWHYVAQHNPVISGILAP